MKVLITGTAGFIGYHLTNKLLANGYQVVGIDNMNDYYDVNLKYARLQDSGIDKNDIKNSNKAISSVDSNYVFYKTALEDRDQVYKIFEIEKPEYVVNLAAQAGVRYSLENPHAYVEANIVGFMNILEACRYNDVKHLVYASSSSVYGLNTKIPFSEEDPVNHPISLYAASKKSNELMAHTYSHLFNLPTTGLRFFTVYGPWGRPDMALFIFTSKILKGEPIEVFNNGDMSRDFTYIDDIVEGVSRLLPKIPTGDNNWDSDHPRQDTARSPFRVYNIGRNKPVPLMDFVHAIEDSLGMKAEINFRELQPGDVPRTYADVSNLSTTTGYEPHHDLKGGVDNFVKWYKSVYLNL